MASLEKMLWHNVMWLSRMASYAGRLLLSWFDTELLGRAWRLPWTEGHRTEDKINLSFRIWVASQIYLLKQTVATAFVKVEKSVKVNLRMLARLCPEKFVFQNIAVYFGCHYLCREWKYPISQGWHP